MWQCYFTSNTECIFSAEYSLFLHIASQKEQTVMRKTAYVIRYSYIARCKLHAVADIRIMITPNHLDHRFCLI